MTDKYYVEYDDRDREWCVVESDAGHENGQGFDALVCCSCSKSDAELIRDALNYYVRGNK